MEGERAITKVIEQTVKVPKTKTVPLFNEQGEQVGEHTVPVTEKVPVIDRQRKLNPAYDPSRTYIGRPQRPEWNLVGLVGLVRLLRGQPTAPSWKKLYAIGNEYDMWLIK
jgi:Peptidase_G2, IMC autoproteolytic cleavage domain